MNIAIKLGRPEELVSLLTYGGDIKNFELPAALLNEKKLINELVGKGFNFYIHGLVMYTPKMREMLVSETNHYLDVCRERGCTNFVLHGLAVRGNELAVDKDRYVDMTLRTLISIKEHAKEQGINCFLENGCFFGERNKQFSEIPSDPEYHIELARKLDMGIVLDLGHAALSAHWQKKLLYEFISVYVKSRIVPRVIHLSDNDLERDGHFALGAGKGDMGSYKKAINSWPGSLLTVENFPDSINKSLMWLNFNFPDKTDASDFEDLCSVMRWRSSVGVYGHF